MNITVKDLDVGQLFFLPNCDSKGTQPNYRYQVTEVNEDGIYATGSILTAQGHNYTSTFWLPNFIKVEPA